MNDNVIVGIKGDDDDRRAVTLACHLASPETRLTLVHVSIISPYAASEREGLELTLNDPRELRDAFSDQLALCPENTRILREHSRSIGTGLQAAVVREDADLLVLGSTVHRGLDRILEGDDVESALARTRCAVAVADAGPPRGHAAISRIGVAYDDTPESSTALAYAHELAASLGARVIPFHVAVPHVYATGFGMSAYPIEDPDSVVKAARTHLESVAGEEVKVVYGDPVYELVELSEHVDLLVCGSRRQATVRRFVFGSTSVSLSRHSHCPLVIAPGTQAVPERSEAAAAAGTTQR